MKQKILFAVLAFLPSYNFGQTVQIDDLNYYLFNGKATVMSNTYYNVSGNCESLYKNDTYSIPETVSYDGIEYVVHKIGSRAFTSYDYLSNRYGGSSLVKTIILPSTVKTIGYEAFIRCYSLKSVDLGGVETIEHSAFRYCI